MFYFDREYIREAASHHCLNPDSISDYAMFYLTTACTHAVLFQYKVVERDLQFLAKAYTVTTIVTILTRTWLYMETWRNGRWSKNIV